MSPEDALRLLETMSPVMPQERVSLADAFERVLARPLFAPFDMPPFPRSAMDGYAVRVADIADATPKRPKVLRIAGEVFAGTTSAAPLEPGTACRIATGGAMPQGADAVLRQEDAIISPTGELITKRSLAAGTDVIAAGANARRGECLLPASWWLDANDIALMAAFGATDADVIGQPRIAYVETGDELVSPGESLPSGHIYGSNNLMLSLRARAHGARVVARRRVGDESPSMVTSFDELLSIADIVVSTGGVSVGPKDFVPGALEALGCQQLFRGLSIRPGHPIIAAHRGEKLWIGLAGNPTAALVTHEFFVRPIIWRMAGLHFSQGFNPACRAALDGPSPTLGARTSLYLGQLQFSQGRETVRVDGKRRPTSLPAPFKFNAIVRSDPAQPDAASSETTRVQVYPADRNVAASRLTPFPWDVGGVLLAGGQSRRMGHSKLFLPLEGVPLIVRAFRALATICGDLNIIGAPSDAVDLLAEWEGEIVRKSCFPDDHPGEGPLAGLITGLRHSRAPMTLCIAADLPFVDGRTLRRLLDAARWQRPSMDSDGSPPTQGFVLSYAGEQQPLAALYPTARSLVEAKRLWRDGGRAMHQFVARLGVHEVPSDRSLTNINFPEEYRAARVISDSTQTSRPGREAAISPPLLAFSGHSGSGKTTLISRLLPLLKERGLRAVVIKHGSRFELDKPGKDSWYFKEAGADGVLLFSSEELAYMARPDTPPSFSELVHKVEQDADVILVEGFKAHPIPKVVVLRDDETWPEHPLADDPHVQAVYGGLATEDATLPAFARTPTDGEDAVLPWLLHWITRHLAPKA